MPASSLEVADIFRAHGQRWRQAHAGHISLAQLKVMSAMTHHPHVHGIVPGGGLSTNGQRWVSCRPGYFYRFEYCRDCLDGYSWKASTRPFKRVS